MYLVSPLSIRVAWIAGVCLLIFAGPLVGQQSGDKGVVRQRDASASTGKSLAILVGVQDYTRLTPLRFCNRDVNLLAKTLTDHAGFDRVVKLTREQEDRYHPTKSNILEELDAWLEVANSGDYRQVLLFFSGHGFQDNRGRLYFAPSGCSPRNLELTGLPMSYVRQQLDACDKVKVKWLVLDTCHAGQTKGDGEGEAADDIAKSFNAAKGLFTLASCQSSEVSLEWDQRQHGLFTYWLCEGLKGHADLDGDTQIDNLELYKYTYQQVLATSVEIGRRQHVTQRPSEDWRGVAVLAKVDQTADRPRQNETAMRTLPADLPETRTRPAESTPANDEILKQHTTVTLFNTVFGAKVKFRVAGGKPYLIDPRGRRQVQRTAGVPLKIEYFSNGQWEPIAENASANELNFEYVRAVTLEGGEFGSVWTYRWLGAQQADASEGGPILVGREIAGEMKSHWVLTNEDQGEIVFFRTQDGNQRRLAPGDSVTLFAYHATPKIEYFSGQGWRPLGGQGTYRFQIDRSGEKPLWSFKYRKPDA